MKKEAPILYCLLALTLVMGYSCKWDKEDNTKLLSLDSCDVRLEFDAETTTLISPANPSDMALLSTLDSALMLPQRDRRLETICLSENGDYTMETEILDPDLPITYPERVVGLWPKPEYKRMVNDNGAITFYNAENEEIDAEIVEDVASLAMEVVEMFQELDTLPTVSNQQVTNALDSISAHGMSFTIHNDSIYTTQVNHSDGTFSVMVINKNARMKVGQLDYEADGTLSTLYMLKVSGQAPNVVFEHMRQVTFFNAVDSEVRMKMEQITVFNSFDLNH